MGTPLPVTRAGTDSGRQAQPAGAARGWAHLPPCLGHPPLPAAQPDHGHPTGSAQPQHLCRSSRAHQERASLHGSLGTSAAISGARPEWYSCQKLGVLSPRLVAGDAARGTSPSPDQGHQKKNTSLHSLRDHALVLTHQLEKHMCIGLSWLTELASAHMASATQAQEYLLRYCQ